MSTSFSIHFFWVFLMSTQVLWATIAHADEHRLFLEEAPEYGVYFSKREPAFYTGFAARVDNPKAIHLHVGRGNQLRVTQVVSKLMQRNYVRDLHKRLNAYKGHINSQNIKLSQNQEFKEFERVLKENNLLKLLEGEKKLRPLQIEERNWKLMKKLNPGRTFDIAVKLSDLAKNWREDIRIYEEGKKTKTDKLILINSVFPTRFHVSEISSKLEVALQRALEASKNKRDQEAYRNQFQALFSLASDGVYRVSDGVVTAREFTAIYPIGTWNSFVELNGRNIPAYPTPGRRALTTHQRSKTVDHIPTKVAYSYFPWIPYMHVGSKLHNSFHTLWWQASLNDFPFLPPAWREAASKNGSGKLDSLFLLSRGPMSHGCTHVNAGHILELRQMLPGKEVDMYRVDAFLNRSYDYDVFDINGDLKPEVMGVKYFIAYSLKDKKPDKLRVPNRRKEYYDWLYGGELRYRADDKPYFLSPRAGAFVGRQAVAGKKYHDLPLYEAAYEEERLQFFNEKPIPFVRALRQVGTY